MELAEASSFVRNFKGAALSVLFLMSATRTERRNWTRDDLARHIGYSRPTTADGLQQLELQQFIIRVDRYTWQLNDQGIQLSFENVGVKNFDSRSQNFLLPGGGGLKNHDMHVNSYSLNHHHHGGVKNFDSNLKDDSIFEELVASLIHVGATPAKARAAIDQAWTGEVSDQAVRRRILWWRCYCVTHNSMKFPGNLIASRVAEGTDTPADFQPRDIPPRFSELRDELEDFEWHYQQSEA